ncbi:MAG: hypothetical protein K0Q59_2276 [Paenibacillus sp.]|nr:hypothetical protein [Paenibacillus sp.]
MIRNSRSAFSRKARLLVLIFAVLCLAFAPNAALAGPEGIYINGSSYFTMDKVRLSEASDESLLRFSITLHNGGSTPVDYNQYGVRVVDAGGYSYSAQLTGQQSARVQPGKDQEFAYEAHLVKGVTADQLHVSLFSWNYSSATLMNELGTFSVQNAMEYAAELAPLAIVPLSKVDATLASDVNVEFRVGSEYEVFDNNERNLYIDLIASNPSDTGFVLPAGLKMRLENAAGQTLAVTAIDGTDKTLLPGKPQRMTIKAAVPDDDSVNDWMLQFYYLNANVVYPLDSMHVGQSLVRSNIGDTRSIVDNAGLETVAVQVEKAIVSQSDDGQWVSATVRVDNRGGKVAAVPKLSAKLQSQNGSVSVTAEDTNTHKSYISPNESESFVYSALMPNGLNVADIELALFENRGTTTTNTANNTANTNTNTANNTANNTNTNNGTATTSKIVPVLIAGLGNAQIYVQGSGNDYTIGDKLNLTLDKKIDISIAELKQYDNDSNGFKTVVAKLRVANADSTVVATPDLALELVDAGGQIFTGVKQATAVTQLATTSNYLISYSFLMPSIDDNGPMLLRVYNSKTAGKVPLESVKVALQQEDTTDDVWDLFPYQVSVNNTMLTHSVLSTTFSYTLKLDVQLQRQQQIVADANLSKILFELVDSNGQVMSTQTMPLLGTTRLVNGSNDFTFSNLKVNQYNSTNYINIYETVETPNGTVKRLLGTVR